MTPAARPPCGVLLAGGLSARFGAGPKGLAMLGSQRLADYPLQALSAVCDEVIIAANDPEASRWFPGHRVVADLAPDRSALAALHTALHAAHGRDIVVCAWDMPFVTPDVLQPLVDALVTGVPCCVPLHRDGGMEPLCAAYSAGCAPVADVLLARGERAAHALCRAAGGMAFNLADAMPADRAERTFFNVNTLSDLEVAEHWLLSHPPHT